MPFIFTCGLPFTISSLKSVKLSGKVRGFKLVIIINQIGRSLKEIAKCVLIRPCHSQKLTSKECIQLNRLPRVIDTIVIIPSLGHFLWVELRGHERILLTFNGCHKSFLMRWIIRSWGYIPHFFETGVGNECFRRDRELVTIQCKVSTRELKGFIAHWAVHFGLARVFGEFYWQANMMSTITF